MAEISLAALANSRRLMDDANYLRKTNRLPSAFMVAGLAADELGKHILVSSFYGARENTEAEWKKFWKRFRNHESKLGDALTSAWTGDLHSLAPLPDPAAFHRERLAATYVDVDPNGDVNQPHLLVSAEAVDEALGTISTELQFCESVLGRASPVQLAETFELMRDSSEASELRELAESDRPLALVAFVTAARSGIPMDRAIAFARDAERLLGTPTAADHIERTSPEMGIPDCPD